jgi:hypothetical protein
VDPGHAEAFELIPDFTKQLAVLFLQPTQLGDIGCGPWDAIETDPKGAKLERLSARGFASERRPSLGKIVIEEFKHVARQGVARRLDHDEAIPVLIGRPLSNSSCKDNVGAGWQGRRSGPAHSSY